MSEEIKSDLNKLAVLIERLSGEIDVSEEKLKSKLDTTKHLEDIQGLKDVIFPKIEEVDKRITNLYIKVAMLSGGSVGVIELIKGVIT